jgi:pyruvate formate lyase activating enzyme
MSKSREMDRLSDRAMPEDLARAAASLDCRSVAFTYNDPVIFLEYAVDAAQACHQLDVRSVAVTAGYICDAPRERFFAVMDAANVDLKAFSEDFYRKTCGASLAPVLETLEYLKSETDVWLELTTLLIPGHNDSENEIQEMTQWVVSHLGPDVPMHFTAFHPDWKMLDVAATSPASLSLARDIALANGVRYVYTGNVHDPAGGSTWCHQCGALLIERDWYQLGRYQLDSSGHCTRCGTLAAGVFSEKPGSWGRQRRPIRLAEHQKPRPDQR